MLLRAVFWLGLVALMVPHEPDLGFGRPGPSAVATAGAPPSTIARLIQNPSVQDACANHAVACAGGLSILDSFQAMAVRSLDEVRADIEAHKAKQLASR
ncbi:MAG: hypothetical protein ISS15_09595 [Alphaproteobacteria bacterium]|nr:hypothetical protein [Alphaproteobacteria bacterium]MBL7097900.1 hypothetical protein [Alphaproteobacteria bacterium]